MIRQDLRDQCRAVATRPESAAEPLTHQSQQDRQLLCQEERAVLVRDPAYEHSDPVRFTTALSEATKQGTLSK